MKKFKSICAQGDVLIRRVDKIPASAKPIDADGSHVIVTHSETGHHHVMLKERTDLFQDADNPLIAWIRVNRADKLIHQRPYDTHEPISFEPGCYEVRRQREHTPEGWRRVAD